jgi:O-antigen/teichoic acid export membrane protein
MKKAAKHEMRKTSMNKSIWIILAVTAIVALFLMIIYYGILAFVLASFLGFVVLLLIEQAYKMKKKKNKREREP